jgi:hypothetical protein
MSSETLHIPISSWLENYKQGHAALLHKDPEFARWLDEEYRPLAGRWQY